MEQCHNYRKQHFTELSKTCKKIFQILSTETAAQEGIIVENSRLIYRFVVWDFYYGGNCTSISSDKTDE